MCESHVFPALPPSLLQCFIYHIDKGLRAGGGIGDVLKSASGEPDEILRLLFDVTFFFFVIVILLAIIQGLYSLLHFSILCTHTRFIQFIKLSTLSPQHLTKVHKHCTINHV